MPPPGPRSWCRGAPPSPPRYWGDPAAGDPAPSRPRAGRTAPTTPRRLIDYPSGRLLAVCDAAASADRATAALLEAGWDAGSIERLAGPDAADSFDPTGGRHGFLARLRRLVQFSVMDQMPDLAWYQAAVRDGRIVLSVAAPDGTSGARAAAIVEACGGHFINRYGRFQTEEHAPWRGPEPGVSDLMRR